MVAWVSNRNVLCKKAGDNRGVCAAPGQVAEFFIKRACPRIAFLIEEIR